MICPEDPPVEVFAAGAADIAAGAVEVVDPELPRLRAPVVGKLIVVPVDGVEVGIERLDVVAGVVLPPVVGGVKSSVCGEVAVGAGAGAGVLVLVAAAIVSGP